MSASSKCPHSDLHYALNTVSFDDANVKSLEIKATCNVCGATMRFLGCPIGVSFKQPTASAFGDEIRIPLVAMEEEPNVESGLVGAVLGEGAAP